MTQESKPRTVELVKSDYQPTKVELEEEFDLDISGGTEEERLDSLGQALTETVNIRWINQPRKRRK